jgi:hypothetical protein
VGTLQERFKARALDHFSRRGASAPPCQRHRASTAMKDRALPPRRAELLIDCEEDRMLRAVLVGMLRDRDRGR